MLTDAVTIHSRRRWAPWKDSKDARLRFALPGQALFEGGAANPAFRCGGGGGGALEPDSFAVRRLVLGRAEASVGLLAALTPSWMAGPAGAAPDGDARPALRITGAKVAVLEADPAVTTLRAALDTSLEGLELDEDVGVTVLYDCWREGVATVELRLMLGGGAAGQAAEAGEATTPAGEEVCLGWRKACAAGWGGLVVHEGAPEGQAVAFEDGAVREDWRATMAAEGTHDTLTRLQLSAPGGVLRLRPPTVTVSDGAVLHAGLVFPELQDLEVAASPVEMSVRHTCLADGAANVTLALERAVLSDERRSVRHTCLADGAANVTLALERAVLSDERRRGQRGGCRLRDHCCHSQRAVASAVVVINLMLDL
ncbi:unnamed protein product [Prorocentrum cordatum]|uniref:Beta-galactosidase n=1 Tax=Prorocentrum cordatum TaxID=2364126 RepID=A0ABN9UQQ2_9DINO|nr:unnamed protein product [Polarella glacialis]